MNKQTCFSEMGPAVSRDRVSWSRALGIEGFAALSPVEDNIYDTAQIEPAARPIRHGDELWFYYSRLRYRYAADNRHHDFDIGTICIAMLRLDGFVSLGAADSEQLCH